MATKVSLRGHIPGRWDDTVRLVRQEVTKASLRAELGVTIGPTIVGRETSASADIAEIAAGRRCFSVFIADAHHPHLFPTFKGSLVAESQRYGGTELILDGEYRAPLGPLNLTPGRLGSDAAALAGLKRWFDDLVYRLQRDALATGPGWLLPVAPLSLRDR
ncbi:MAG TPA: hypothetical protein VLL25_13030 [Acidimicrobiales bacterium]|nr:hypothetical protein [Acidimicrobiales bacterium]